MSGTPQVVAAQSAVAITADATTRRASRGTVIGPGVLGEYPALDAFNAPTTPIGMPERIRDTTLSQAEPNSGVRR